MAGSGQHSSKSMNHGTPVIVVEAARYTLGAIDFDPASDAYWNHHVVKASRFCDGGANGNGLEADYTGRGLINPPGDKPGTLPPMFWDRLTGFWTLGSTAVVWVGFSLEQLPRLQIPAPALPRGPKQYPGNSIHPLRSELLRCFPSSRLDFLAPGKTFDDPPVPQTQPGHGNYIAFLPPLAHPDEATRMRARFVEAFSTIGAIL
jgi:hypothetical protein